MPPKKLPKATAGTGKLVAHNFLPTLTKPDQVLGEFISMAGKEWSGCPAADKEKLFRCVKRFGSSPPVHRRARLWRVRK